MAMLWLASVAALFASGPDPFVAVHDGNFYITYTPGRDVRVRRAASLEALGTAEPLTVWKDDDPSRCCNIWAPEIHRLGARWYVYYTAGSQPCCAAQRMHVLESEGDSPLGPYRYKGRLFDPRHDDWAIDPTVFESRGRRYVIYSGTPRDRMPHEKPQNLYIAELENPWTLKGGRSLISEPDLEWEKKGGGVNEGPAVLVRGGKVFVAYSGSGCYTDDYAAGWLEAAEGSDLLARSSWKKHPQPWLRTDAASGRFAPGHNAFFRLPGTSEDWTVYHANPKPGLGCGSARRPFVRRILWSASGTPELAPDHK
jgi:GH43 family beta-xylosidase